LGCCDEVFIVGDGLDSFFESSVKGGKVVCTLLLVEFMKLLRGSLFVIQILSNDLKKVNDLFKRCSSHHLEVDCGK